MPETSTTAPVADDDASKSTTVNDDTTTATDTKTASDSNNLDASKSDDKTVVADDDKKSDTTTKTDDTPASFDDDLDEWITKRKFAKPTNDEERQAYQDLRNQQREYTREQQSKKESDDINKEVEKVKSTLKEDDEDDLDPLEKRQNEMDARFTEERNIRLRSEFYVANKVTSEEHKMILDVMAEKFNRPTTDEGKKKALETWSDPSMLTDLLDIARGRIAKTVDTSDIEAEAARKERERIARESESKSPGRAASQSTTSNEDINSDEARRKRFEARYNK